MFVRTCKNLQKNLQKFAKLQRHWLQNAVELLQRVACSSGGTVTSRMTSRMRSRLQVFFQVCESFCKLLQIFAAF